MKKHFWVYLSFMLFTLMLAACGNGATNTTAASNTNKEITASKGPSNTNTESTNAAPATRKYTHLYGETEIPVKPERVVTLQYASQMLSVGLKPIAASHYLLEDTGSEFQGIEDIGSDKINFEKILTLQPDLIIAGDIDEDVYDKLSKIAPTVVVPWMDYDVYGHVKVIGDILNRQKEAADWKTAFDNKIKEAKEKIMNNIGADKTFAIYRVDPKEFYVYGVRNIGFTLYKALGLTPPPLLQKEMDKDPNLWAVPISLEVLPDYSADYVFVTLLDGEEASSRFDEIKNTAFWKNLPAVKNNHVYQISMDSWLGYTPHDIDHQLQEAVQLLTGVQ